MRIVVLGSLFTAAILAAVPAVAQVKQYSGRVTSGQDVGGSSRCGTYAMNMNLTVNGSDIKATFLQDGRTERNFSATADASGAFKTKTTTGGGAPMNVTGKVTPNEVTVRLDGYCIFNFKLAPKS
jgi:hypothetical protein